MSPDRHIAILAKAARERLDLLEDGETSLSYYGEADEIRAALAWAEAPEPSPQMRAAAAKALGVPVDSLCYDRVTA